MIDASAVVQACLAAEAFGLFGGEVLVTPPLGRSESMSAIHEMRLRGEISDALAAAAFDALLAAPVRPRAPAKLRREAWRIADQLGWAKTYDAEYVALARLVRCRLFTIDERLRRGPAARLVEIIGPDDL